MRSTGLKLNLPEGVKGQVTRYNEAHDTKSQGSDRKRRTWLLRVVP